MDKILELAQFPSPLSFHNRKCEEIHLYNKTDDVEYWVTLKFEHKLFSRKFEGVEGVGFSDIHMVGPFFGVKNFEFQCF